MGPRCPLYLRDWRCRPSSDVPACPFGGLRRAQPLSSEVTPAVQQAFASLFCLSVTPRFFNPGFAFGGPSLLQETPDSLLAGGSVAARTVPGMAIDIDKRTIKKLPVQAYDAVRDSLRSGDLVFCSGSYVFSGLIQRLTKSVWSHVGIVYRDESLGRVFILESETGIGVRLVPVSKYLRDYHGRRRPYRGQIVVGRVLPGLTPDQVRQGVSFGMDLLTKPYDNHEILRILVRIAFKISRGTRDRKYICSELVDECFRAVGVRFTRPDNYISPQDIWRNEAVTMQARIL